jgi:hypothetical protein
MQADRLALEQSFPAATLRGFYEYFTRVLDNELDRR